MSCKKCDKADAEWSKKQERGIMSRRQQRDNLYLFAWLVAHGLIENPKAFAQQLLDCDGFDCDVAPNMPGATMTVVERKFE